MSKSRARTRVRIGTVPTPDRVVSGKLAFAGGRYKLTVGTRRIEVPIGFGAPEADLRALAKAKQVAVALAPGRAGAVIAIGTWPTPEVPRFRCVLCYIPAPDVFRRINPVVREAVVREMVREKIMSPALAHELTGKNYAVR